MSDNPNFESDEYIASAKEARKRERDSRPCTCHPSDWPQRIPCQHKYALKDCMIEAIRNDLAMIA